MELQRQSTTESDGNVIRKLIKTLDANKYATKKTIAQGLLDVALLTANASQLKYILQVGEKHEFYKLMLTLIIISIVLQVVQGVVCILLGTNYDLNEEHHLRRAKQLNNANVILNILTVVVNVVLNVLDMDEDFGVYDFDYIMSNFTAA